MGEHPTRLLRLLAEMPACSHCALVLSGMSAQEKCSPEGMERLLEEHVAHREDAASVKKSGS